ncbi:hypothetical protein MHB77_26445 [Paenibacillus sp. FSL K6-3166]|uniref:hypothetical protein n=1 Tax=unclassified Paenibacillus TaxID=185978 RepID=UPI000B9FD6A3|nr:hypothetical protein [Paenibacillus sp. VTT E-133291]OZQ89011.1 hypothetical protein CA598_14630 [Paenibacillus sp. VTT E-133291]
MKKRVVKATLAAAMLFSVVLGQGVAVKAETITPVVTAKPITSEVPAATVKPAVTPAPIMRDNLFKFGLKKDLELPVTVTAGGLSYTLEKLMFYDVKSKEAQSLMKLYGYSDRIYKTPTKYMVWTKLTIENKGSKIIQLSAKDPSSKWYFKMDGNNLLEPAPKNKMLELNNKEALWNWVLKPGEKLSSYQMYGYIKDPSVISIYVNLGGDFEEKYIVKRQGSNLYEENLDCSAYSYTSFCIYPTEH